MRRPLLKCLKWLVAPIAFVVAGYFLLGPRLAGDGRISKIVKKGAEIVRLAPGQKPEEESEAEAAGDGAGGDDGAPRVSVGVKPVEERSRRR